jgi:hypothetical protein
MSADTRESSGRLAGLTVAASLLLVLSLMLVPASVHTYCENRIIASGFAVASVGIGLVLVFSKTQTREGHVIRVCGLIVSLLAIAIDTAFTIYATRTCV